MSDDEQTEQQRLAAEDVECRAREMVRSINAGSETEREFLRELAVSILRDEVQLVDHLADARVPAIGTFNFFGIGIPLFLIGAVLVFLFPPIGVLFLAAAVLTVVSGVGVILFSRRRTT